MRSFLFLFILLLSVNFTIQGQDQLSDYQHALLLYNQGRYPEALTYFNKAITDYPANNDAWYRRGYCHAMLGRFDDARKDFRKAGTLGTDEAHVNIGLGFLYNEAGKYKKAIVYLTRAIRTDGSIPEAYTNRGLSYQNLGQHTRAIADYTEAIRLDSGIAMAYNNRGSAIYANQDVAAPSKLDTRKALKDFNLALHFDPNLCIARMNRGLAYSFISMYDSAIAELDLAAKCDANNYLVFLNRGDVKYKKGDYTEAVSDYMEALRINPNVPHTYMQMGKAKSRLGYLAEAIADQEKALSLDMRLKPWAAYNIASHYAAAGQKEDMMTWLEKAKKAGYFKVKDSVSEFEKNEDFKEFRADKDFRAFTAGVR